MLSNLFYYITPIGKIGIVEKAGKITNVFFETDSYKDEYILKETEVLKEAGKQLLEYLQAERRAFCLPLDPLGTVFMKSVWESLRRIPYGATQSYKEIAKMIGNEKACRTVGLANNKNPIPIFIPCHRVIGANGKLTGYRGGLELKQQLLDLENDSFNKLSLKLNK